jgi:hypothetical protein
MNERTKKELRFWIVVSTLVVVAFFTSRYLTGRSKVPDTSRIPIPSAKWDGRYPCVTMDFANASARPAVKRCSVATENNAATDGVEVDLRWGKFILRQTDLFVIDDMPIVLYSDLQLQRVVASKSGSCVRTQCQSPLRYGSGGHAKPLHLHDDRF